MALFRPLCFIASSEKVCDKIFKPLCMDGAKRPFRKIFSKAACKLQTGGENLENLEVYVSILSDMREGIHAQWSRLRMLFSPRPFENLLKLLLQIVILLSYGTHFKYSMTTLKPHFRIMLLSWKKKWYREFSKNCFE